MHVQDSRSRIDWSYVRQSAAKAALPIWFLALSASVVTTFVPNHVGIDATNYLGATRTWLSGGDPWVGVHGGFAFVAPPMTLLAVLPFAILPDPMGWIGMLAVGPVMVVLALRLLRLPWWWAAFPPMVVCICIGNPGAWLPALMFAPPLAIIAKAYAAVPLIVLGRWRAMAMTAILLAVTFPLLPWDKFVADWPLISANLANQTQNSVAGPLLPSVVVFAILLVRDREKAAWLAVPIAWPHSQWTYSTLSIPAGWVCAILAIPIPGSPILAGLAALLLPTIARRRELWRVPTTALPRPRRGSTG